MYTGIGCVIVQSFNGPLIRKLKPLVLEVKPLLDAFETAIDQKEEYVPKTDRYNPSVLEGLKVIATPKGSEI